MPVLTVVGGTGSGTYATSAVVPIASTLPAWQFGIWSPDWTPVTIADRYAPATTVTIPDRDLTIVADAIGFASVAPKLAEIETEVAGVTEAFEQAPASITAADLPCVVNLPQSTTLEMEAAGEDEGAREVFEVITVRALLFVAAAATPPAEAFGRCEPFFSRVRDVFLKHPHVKTARGAFLPLKLMGAGAVSGKLEYAGQLYTGIPFTVQISLRLRGSKYGANE